MMVKTRVSLTEDIDQKVTEYMLIHKIKYSQAIRTLVELGIESLKNSAEIIDLYNKIKEIFSQNLYIIALLEQFYSDMEVDGGTNPKDSEALKMFWAKRVKDPFNE